MSRALMQQALEALEWNYNTDLDNIPACEQWAKMLNETITALRAALAEPEQEPVAWADMDVRGEDKGLSWTPGHFHKTPLYTAPTPRKPLTDEQISVLWDGHTVPVFGKTGINPIVFARAIERAHGIGEQHGS